jgi:hypothetical protein
MLYLAVNVGLHGIPSLTDYYPEKRLYEIWPFIDQYLGEGQAERQLHLTITAAWI